jgi:hypothetical protein
MNVGGAVRDVDPARLQASILSNNPRADSNRADLALTLARVGKVPLSPMTLRISCYVIDDSYFGEARPFSHPRTIKFFSRRVGVLFQSDRGTTYLAAV